MIIQAFTKDGAFACGDTVTGIATMALAGSIAARQARFDPAGSAYQMLEGEWSVSEGLREPASKVMAAWTALAEAWSQGADGWSGPVFRITKYGPNGERLTIDPVFKSPEEARSRAKQMMEPDMPFEIHNGLPLGTPQWVMVSGALTSVPRNKPIRFEMLDAAVVEATRAIIESMGL